jgi:hypothetical protein
LLALPRRNDSPSQSTRTTHACPGLPSGRKPRPGTGRPGVLQLGRVVGFESAQNERPLLGKEPCAALYLSSSHPESTLSIATPFRSTFGGSPFLTTSSRSFSMLLDLSARMAGTKSLLSAAALRPPPPPASSYLKGDMRSARRSIWNSSSQMGAVSTCPASCGGRTRMGSLCSSSAPSRPASMKSGIEADAQPGRVTDSRGAR